MDKEKKQIYISKENWIKLKQLAIKKEKKMYKIADEVLGKVLDNEI